MHVLSPNLTTDDRNGRPSRHSVQHPDLWGDLRLFPHHVGYASRGHSQSDAFLHRPEPQREQGSEPLQTQGLKLLRYFILYLQGSCSVSINIFSPYSNRPKSKFSTNIKPSLVRIMVLISSWYSAFVGILDLTQSGCALSVTSNTGKKEKGCSQQLQACDSVVNCFPLKWTKADKFSCSSEPF